MLRRNRKNFLNYIKFLERNKIPFSVDVSNKSYTVQSKLGKRFFSDNFMSPDALSLIRQVKKYVQENNIHEKIKRKTPAQLNIRYLCFDRKYIGKRYVRIAEVDINKAYWDTALTEGLINKEIYEKGNHIKEELGDKIAMLASLGTLAKRVTRRHFDGNRYQRNEPIMDSAETRHLWDLVSYKVDQVMQACMKSLTADFSFYWTDAIFFRASQQNHETVNRVIKNMGYGCKIIENAWYDFRKDACYVYTLFTAKKGRKMKKEHLQTLNLAWVRENVDWDRELEVWAKAVIDNNQLYEKRKKAGRLEDEEKRKEKAPELYQLSAPPTKEEILKMSDKNFGAFIMRTFRVRNFCYAITNHRMWKGRKLAKR